MRIGAHISTRGNYAKMLDYAHDVGCETFAIFAKSPRMWHAKPLEARRGDELRMLMRASSIDAFYTHTSYLINISSVDGEMRGKSVLALADELVRAAILGAAGVNTHLGNDAAGDADAAAVRTGAAIAVAVRHAGESLERLAGAGAFSGFASFAACGASAPCVPRLLLEDTAGAGSTFGATVAQLAASVAASGLDAAALGICLDTCHAWAQGYDVSTAGGWDELLGEVDDACGLERLGLLHANDCKFARGAHKDRHEQLGQGAIGEAGFAAMVADSRLADVDVILEVPGEEPGKDIDNIAFLKRLRDEATSR